MYDLSNGFVSSDLEWPLPRFQGHSVIFMPKDALSVLYVQLTRSLFAIAKFLFLSVNVKCQRVEQFSQIIPRYYKNYETDTD